MGSVIAKLIILTCQSCTLMCRVIYKVELTSKKVVGDDFILKIKNGKDFFIIFITLNIYLELSYTCVHMC